MLIKNRPCPKPCGPGTCFNCRPTCCGGVEIAGEYRITFFGLVDDECSDCGDLNSPTSFIVTVIPVGARCGFLYTASEDPCDIDAVQLFFDKVTPTDPQEYQAAVTLTTPTGIHFFRKLYTQLIPCCSTIRADWWFDQGSPDECDASSAYAVIEPIIAP